MSSLYRYASTDPIYFKITKDGDGFDATLAAGDVRLSKDGGTVADIDGECTAVDSTNMVGVFEWQPTSGTQTTADMLIIAVKDIGGTAFDENLIILQTGGDSNARLNGT